MHSTLTTSKTIKHNTHSMLYIIVLYTYKTSCFNTRFM